MRATIAATLLFAGFAHGNDDGESGSPQVTAFENQLAESLIASVLLEAQQSHPAKRLKVLQQGARQLNSDVDFGSLRPDHFRAAMLLTYVGKDEPAATVDVRARIPPLVPTSDNWKSIGDTQQGSHPPDSFAGRQHYLDQLASTLVSAESLLALTTSHNNYPDLSFSGVEDPTSPVFRYSSGELQINLARTQLLPYWEIPTVALFYGFPGHHTVNGIRVPEAFRFVMNLPRTHDSMYQLGWSLYALMTLPTLPMESAAERQARHWFMTLQWAGLQWELTGDNSAGELEDLVGTVMSATPYSRDRIRSDLTSVAGESREQAFRLALVLRDAHDMAIAKGIEASELNDEILALGRVPTGFLAFYLPRWISDHGHEDGP